MNGNDVGNIQVLLKIKPVPTGLVSRHSACRKVDVWGPLVVTNISSPGDGERTIWKDEVLE